MISGVGAMEKSAKRLDRPSFWKWAIPLVLGFVVLAILRRGAVRAAYSVGGTDTVVIVVTAMALARLVLIVLLAMALARRFRDIGWRAWIGPTILLVTMLVPPFLVPSVIYAIAIYTEATSMGDIREWTSMVGWISDCVSLVLLIVAGSMPGRPASIEVAHVFE